MKQKQLTVLLTLFALNTIAMDEPFQCKVPVRQETNIRQPAKTQKPKLNQAELDGIQFAKEQETKKFAAEVNKQPQDERQKIQNGLKNILKDTQIKGRPFNTSLVEKLPAPIQKEIVKLSYSPTAYSNGYQLLPALIPHFPRVWGFSRNQNFYERIGANRYKYNFSVQVTEGNFSDSLFNMQEYQSTVTINRSTLTKDGENGSWGHSFLGKRKMPAYSFKALLANHVLYLPKSSMRDILESCSEEQLNLIRDLWARNERIESRARLETTYTDIETVLKEPIILNSKEKQLYNSLPTQIRVNLESNYRVNRRFKWDGPTVAAMCSLALLTRYAVIELWKRF